MAKPLRRHDRLRSYFRPRSPKKIPFMRQIRLFVDAPLAPGMELAVPADAAQHALRVLRLKQGDSVILFNGDGHQYPAHLLSTTSREALAHIEACESPERESRLRVTLLQALARGEKMDWIIQKATELGVARIVPMLTERSEVKLDAARRDKRVAHWRAIAIAACEQCGRNRLPEIDMPAELDADIVGTIAANSDLRWMLHPEGAVRLRDTSPSPQAVTLAVGPEGGFAESDLAALRNAGFQALGLGPRILRTETAGIAALAGLQSLYGDF